MTYYSDELYHHGVKGQKWGVRRYQNSDGSLTDAGRTRYGRKYTGSGGRSRRVGSYDSGGEKKSSNWKKAAAIGAGVAGAAALGYGAYRLRKGHYTARDVAGIIGNAGARISDAAVRNRRVSKRVANSVRSDLNPKRTIARLKRRGTENRISRKVLGSNIKEAARRAKSYTPGDISGIAGARISDAAQTAAVRNRRVSKRVRNTIRNGPKSAMNNFRRDYQTARVYGYNKGYEFGRNLANKSMMRKAKRTAKRVTPEILSPEEGARIRKRFRRR